MKKTLPLARIVTLVICSVVAIFVLFPMLIVVVGSLRTNGELLNDPFGWPHALHWENYGALLASGSLFWQSLWNSIVVLLESLVLLLVVSCPAAFVLARISFPGREVVFNIYLLGLLFPLTLAILPLYITIRNLGLLNSLEGISLPQTAFFLPMTILILRNFFRAIPRELEDAAEIDGASKLRFFWHILLPLARPALAVVTILATVNSWNNFLLPLLVLNDQSKLTLPVAALQFQSQYSSDWVSILAFLTLSMIPAIVIYFLAERQIVAGLTAGAVKG
jgi:raffinose/stachyose/melibiose transport system permease protein